MSAISIDYHSKPGTRIFLFLSVILLTCLLAGCNAGDSPGANDIETSSVEPTPGATVADKEPSSSGEDRESASSVADKEPSSSEGDRASAATEAAETPPSPDPGEEPWKLPGDDEVLATVDGSPITQFELEQAIRTSLGGGAMDMLDDQGRRKVLESLVASRAIAREQEKKLTDDERAVLKKRMDAFREQLLVKMHLARKKTLSPVTRRMVKDYYRAHPDQFGQKIVRRYEMIRSEGPLTDESRDKFLEELKGADAAADWDRLILRLRIAGLSARRHEGRVDPEALDSRLRDLMRPLASGQTSEPTFIDGVLHLVRITEETRTPPRPLPEVSVEISKMLTPAQYKKAAKQAAEQALARTKVEYLEN